MNAWMWLRSMHQICHFQTREGKKVGRATNSELKRWLSNGALKINNEPVLWNEEMDFNMFSVRLFSSTLL
jgi:hypothetical protein